PVSANGTALAPDAEAPEEMTAPGELTSEPESSEAFAQAERTMAVPITPVKPPAESHKNQSYDPFAVVHHLQAWMPKCIAEYKLRGFIGDVGGEIIESVPGCILVRFGGRGSVYSAPRQGMSWLGITRRSNNIDMELRLDHADDSRGNQLSITVT